MLVETDDLMLPSTAAEKLKDKLSAITNAIADGRIDFVTIDGKKFITKDGLEKYRQRTRPKGEKPAGRPPRVPEPDAGGVANP